MPCRWLLPMPKHMPLNHRRVVKGAGTQGVQNKQPNNGVRSYHVPDANRTFIIHLPTLGWLLMSDGTVCLVSMSHLYKRASSHPLPSGRKCVINAREKTGNTRETDGGVGIGHADLRNSPTAVVITECIRRTLEESREDRNLHDLVSTGILVYLCGSRHK